MAWVTKSGKRLVGGTLVPYTYQVWVADTRPASQQKPIDDRPKKKKAPLTATPAQIAAAKRKAQSLSAAQKKREAQKQMYAALQRRANDIRQQIAPSTLGKSVANDSLDQRADREKTTAAETLKQKQLQAEKNKWKAYEDFYRRQAEAAARRAALDKAKKETGTKATGVSLEKLIADARKRQETSGGTDLDTEYVKEITQAYIAHRDSVASNFNKRVEEIQQYYIVNKKGKLVGYKDEASYLKAKKIINDPDFQKLQGEYERLFGDGKKNVGTLTTAAGALDQISASQRQYIYDAAKATLFKKVDSLRKSGDKNDRDSASQLMKDWEGGDKWLYDAAAAEIDPAKTSWKFEIDPKTGKMKSTQRTVEEEFEHRKQQYITEMTRQYNQWKRERETAQQRAVADRARMKQEMDGGSYTSRQSDNKMLATAARSLGMTEGPKTYGEKNTLVEEALKTWEVENRKWFFPKGTEPSLGARGVPAKYAQAQAAFARARDKQRTRLFETFGEGAPHFLETALNLPIVKQGLSTLGGVGSLIPAGARAVAYITTGNSTMQVGINMSTLPEDIRNKYQQWVAGTGGPQAPAAVGGGSLTLAPNIRNPLGLLGSGNSNPVDLGGGKSPLDEWLTTDEGKTWYKKYKADTEAATRAQDQAFAKDFYGEGDIWKKFDALSQYGTSPTNSDMFNVAAMFGLDITNVAPLKVWKYLERLRHAKEATEGITGFKGLNRFVQGANEWRKVTEAELRFDKALRPYMASLKNGAKPETVREMILTNLAGIKDGASRAEETAKLFRQFGIDPKSQSGHELLTFAENAFVSKFKAAGIDFQDVAHQAGEIEAARLAKEAAEKMERTRALAVSDAARNASEIKARSIAEESAGKLRREKSADEAALRARAERQAAAPPLEREAANPLDAPGSTPVYEYARAEDPLRRGVVEGVAPGNRYDLDRSASVIDSIHAVDGQVVHGVDFARGPDLDAFLLSDEYKQIVKDLETSDVSNVPLKAGDDWRTAKPQRPKFDPGVQRRAQERLYELGRQSMAKRIREHESLGVPLQGGEIPWERSASGGLPYEVAGGRRSNRQYIPTASDMRSRAGVESPSEELVFQEDLGKFDSLKKNALILRGKWQDGKLTLEQYKDALRENIASFGLYRSSARLDDDIRAGIGRIATVRSEFGMLVDGVDDMIPVGGVLVEDMIAIGHLKDYYKSFSMLPQMMTGAAYETALMQSILDPDFRLLITRVRFAQLLRNPAYFPLESVSPRQFREGGAHLFALFHLTKLDGNMDLLRAYSRSIEVALKSDPYNVYARMWKVMETRAGVPWADGFLVTERAFTEAVIAGGRMHPNLALRMIPYGPIARETASGLGFTGHLRGLSTTLDPRFPASPARWDDDSVTQALTRIFDRNYGPLEGPVQVASKIAHYISSRYGSVLTRASFKNVLDDFSIESSELGARAEGQANLNWQTMRDEYIQRRFERTPDADILDNKTHLVYGKEFDGIFARIPKRGNARRDFPELREIYDEMYWRNGITHDNPGLHTAKLFYEMGNPRRQSGDSWVKYARSYWEHMSAIGAEDEARAVLKTLYDAQIAQVRDLAYEQITKMGRTMAGYEAGEWTMGAKADLFIRSGVVGDMERIIDAGRHRQHASMSYAQKQVDEEIERGLRLVDDDAARTLEAASLSRDDITSMFDGSDLGDVLHDVEQWNLSLAKAVGLEKNLPPYRSGARFSAYTKGYYAARKKDAFSARMYLRGIPEEYRAHLSVFIRRRAAERRLSGLFTSVLRKTFDMGAIPPSVGADIERMVELVGHTAPGRAFINQWAEIYGKDLYRSRLIDYLNNQAWFDDVLAKRGGPNVPVREPVVLGQNPAAVAARPNAAAAPEELPPLPPTPQQLNHDRISMAQEGLRLLSGMSEKEWLGREMLRAQRLRNVAKTSAARSAASERIRDINRALKVIEVAESGGKGSFIPPPAMKTFLTRLVSVAGAQASVVLRPAMVSPYVTGAGGAVLEQGRALFRVLRTAPVDARLGTYRQPGAVSATYAKHGAAIEAEFGQVIPVEFLQRHGFPPTMFTDVTGTMLITELEEFADTAPAFKKVIEGLTLHVESRLRVLTKDPSYSIDRWLDDRLVNRSDYFDALEYERVDKIVQKAIQDARDGAIRKGQLDLKRRPDPNAVRGENPLTELVETDIQAVIGKAKALSELGIDPHAYNEARKVLRSPMLRKNRSISLVAAASNAAADAMKAAGKRVEDADWDKLYRAAYDEAFLAKRVDLAGREGKILLEKLGREMFGSSSAEILTEFEKRYGMDNVVKGFEPTAISPYQRRTLEEAVKTHLNVDDAFDDGQIKAALSKYGQRPPFENRAAMREWLTKYGFWSPRTAEAVESGKKSWSIQEEGDYYRTNWGEVPAWADARLLEEGGDLRHLLFDERARGAKFREWGLFNRNMEARFATGKLTREDRVRLLVNGSLSLGLKAKRDVALERKFVIERYGPLASADGETLIAFPELMNVDELKQYLTVTSKKDIPEGIVDNLDDLHVLEQLMEFHTQKYFDEFVAGGKSPTYEDIFVMSANVVTDMLKNPLWLKRSRDQIGRFLKGQAALRRALVFTHVAFASTNALDSFIKEAWASFTSHAFRAEGPQSAAASKLELIDIGADPLSTQLLSDGAVRGWDRIKEAGKGDRFYVDSYQTVRRETAAQKALADGLERLVGVSEIPADIAGKFESAAKLRLARSMYDGAYAKALKRVGDPELADSIAREFIGSEVGRLWPTSGDGPIERLFNNISPFMSYQFKNRVLFLGEFLAYPAFYNYFNRIGDFIEYENRRRWEEEGRTDIPNETNARLIEIPWAPGMFIDFGSMSDIQRGLKPLYQVADGQTTIGEIGSAFIRLASANDINFAFGLINAMDLSPRYGYIQRYENGFPTGIWDKVQVPWEAPWGGAANLWNSFWPVDLGGEFISVMEGGWKAEELTKLIYQVAFFGGLREHDKGSGLQTFYFALQSKNAAAAKAWLETKDGKLLQLYWLDKQADPKDWYTPKDLKDILNPPPIDKNSWFHGKSEEFQAAVRRGWDELGVIREKWDNVIFNMTPGTEEYREAKLQRATERYEYYRTHPWMYEAEANFMSPDEWAEQLNEWHVDDLVQGYFDIKAPDPVKFDNLKDKNKAFAAWKKQREAYLKMFPEVAQRLGQARSSLEQVWRQTEDGWFDVLEEVGTRGIAIEAAKESKNFDLVDQLYMVNDLSFDVLNEDVVVQYFDPTTDYEPMAKQARLFGVDPKLKKDSFGNELLARIKVLPDFNKWRFDRMDVEEKAKYERDQKYSEGMQGIIGKAKDSKNFGATFVRELKKNKFLLEEYFRRNPGKREKWAATDEYIRQISKYGILAKQGRFAEAGRYFDNLPDWVKDRYYANNPERRQKNQQSFQYMNLMQKWTNFYRKRDYAGGAAYFEKLPQWAKDRYYSKNPNGFGKGGGGSSPYAKAMGGWVKLLQENKDEEAKAYFDRLPQAFKDRYYAKHPDQKLKNDIKRVGQLGQYFAADDANRAVYLQNNPEFAKWLRAQGGSEDTRRMMILAAYQGLPKDDQWLKRVFREKYPEIFSAEGKGERSLRKTYNFLAEHPDMLPDFEKWLAAVWASYEQNVRHSGTRPKPVESDHSRQRQHGTDRYPGRHTGKSAAWVRLHSG